jgi:hypothetical protein
MSTRRPNAWTNIDPSLALLVSRPQPTSLTIGLTSNVVGISTTDIVGRMLLMTKSHHSYSFDDSLDASTSKNETTVSSSANSSSISSNANTAQANLVSKRPRQQQFNRKSNFLTTSRIIRLFAAGVKVSRLDPHHPYP